MKPKFTQKNLGFFWTKILALALIFSASSQFSFAQKRTERSSQQQPGYENTLNFVERQRAQQQSGNSLSGNPAADNDAGLPNRNFTGIQSQRTEAICTTFTGTITAADPALTGPRMFRDDPPSTRAEPQACGTSAPNGCNYDTYSYTNPIGS